MKYIEEWLSVRLYEGLYDVHSKVRNGKAI